MHTWRGESNRFTLDGNHRSERIPFTSNIFVTPFRYSLKSQEHLMPDIVCSINCRRMLILPVDSHANLDEALDEIGIALKHSN